MVRVVSVAYSTTPGPANHPRVRLGQYAAWTRAVPAWPEHLVQLADKIPALSGNGTGGPTPGVRRQFGLTALRGCFVREITGGAVGGTRFDNLMCDGFLPLLSARMERSFFLFWFHWYAGDLPPRLATVLRSLGVFQGRAQPACHGPAQGLLGWMLAREGRSNAGTSAPAPLEAAGAGIRQDPTPSGNLSGEQVQQHD